MAIIFEIHTGVKTYLVLRSCHNSHTQNIIAVYVIAEWEAGQQIMQCRVKCQLAYVHIHIYNIECYHLHLSLQEVEACTMCLILGIGPNQQVKNYSCTNNVHCMNCTKYNTGVRDVCNLLHRTTRAQARWLRSINVHVV